MKSLDTYIQEKREEFENEFWNQDAGRFRSTHSIDVMTDFLAESIRITARETVEAVLPQKERSHFYNESDHNYIFGWNNCRTAILSVAKEKGVIN